MAKRGQKIDELYISLGLDIARLQLDFDTAGKTVSQSIARLNGKANNIRLKMDIDLAKLQGVGTELDKIRVQHQAINQQLDIQRQKEAILVAVLQDAQKTSGKDSNAYQRAESNLLKQQKLVAQSEAEARKLDKQMKKLGETMNATGNAGTRFGKAMAAGFSAAQGSLTHLSTGFSLFSAKTAAVLTLVSTGAGLFSVTEGAMQAGENLYRLTKRLHTTTGEAAKLSRVFQLAGMDVQSVIPLLARLDKQVELAGDTGNDTTRAMERFGISLLDEQQNLLPLNEQLAQLAEGYHHAAEAGQEDAYTAEVLGARGAGLIPILEQYDDLMKIAESVQVTGMLSPEESHKTWLEWKAMEMEFTQLKSTLGTALLPLASELMPSVRDSFEELVQTVQENKDGIKDAIKGWGDALKTVADLLVAVGEQFHTVAERAKANAWLMEHHPAASPLILVPGIGGSILDKMYGDEYKAYQKEQEALKKKAEAERKAAAEAERNKSAAFENAIAARRRAEAEKQAAKATEEAAKANQQLTDSLYDLTHNELEQSLHAIGKEVEELRRKGADIHLLDAYQAARQAKAYENFQRDVVDSTQAVYRTDLQNQLANIDREMAAYRRKGLDEVSAAEWAEASKARVMAQWNQEVAARIGSIWKTELQNRLEDIEREKQAWIQKGLEEVRATQWAEKEKLDAKRNAALQVLQSQKEEFRAYLEGGERGLAEYYKQEHGFTMDDLRMTPGQLAGFERARKHMIENLLPNFRSPEDMEAERERKRQSFRMSVGGEDDAYDNVMNTMQTEVKGIRIQMEKLAAAPVLSGQAGQAPQQTITNAPHLAVNVHIGNAVTKDSDGMRELADTVADRIRPAVEQALGGVGNTYTDW